MHTVGMASTLGRRLRARARVLEAMALVSATAAAQRFIPMTKWSFALGDAAQVPETWRGRNSPAIPRRASSTIETQVVGAVNAASRRLPWKPSCLAEAGAAQVMLRRRHAPGVVVIGLRPSEQDSKWDAHAWLMGRAGSLTGGPAANGFTAVTVFEVHGGLTAREIAVAQDQPG